MSKLSDLIEWVKNELSYTDDHWTLFERNRLSMILNALEVLDNIKHTSKCRHGEFMSYITNRTDSDIGNGVKECDAFNKVVEWLKNEGV